MTDDNMRPGSANDGTHAIEMNAEALSDLEAWARDEGFAFEPLIEGTFTFQAVSSGKWRVERVPVELQKFGTVLIPDPRILNQGPVKVGIFVFEPQQDPVGRGRPQASALYNEIKNAAALQVHHVHCALQLQQRLAVHHEGMTKKEAMAKYHFEANTEHVRSGLSLMELLRIGSSVEKQRNEDRTEIGRLMALSNGVLDAQKNLGPNAKGLAEHAIKLSTSILNLIEKARYNVSTRESRRRAVMAVDRKSGSTTPADLQKGLYGSLDHEKIRTDFVGKTIFSFYTGINASKVWEDTCLAEWQKFFELVVFTGQLYDGRPAILTEQIYNTYFAVDWALSKGTIQGEAEAQAYAFVVDQLHRLIDKNALRMIGENLAEDVDDVELVADFSGCKGD